MFGKGTCDRNTRIKNFKVMWEIKLCLKKYKRKDVVQAY